MEPRQGRSLDRAPKVAPLGMTDLAGTEPVTPGANRFILLVQPSERWSATAADQACRRQGARDPIAVVSLVKHSRSVQTRVTFSSTSGAILGYGGGAWRIYTFRGHLGLATG